MGLVFLGAGQVQAQTESLGTLHTADSFDADSMEAWSLDLLDLPDASTLITTTVFDVKGKQRFWQCADGEVPPNCRFRDPPADINQCGTWSGRFHIVWGVTCPIAYPTQFIFYVNRCAGGRSRVGQWTLSPRGNCADGFFDSKSFSFINPDCATSQPDVCTPPCHGCGFPAFDGSNRRFLTRTTTLTGSTDEHFHESDTCFYDCMINLNTTRRDSYNNQCVLTSTGSGSGSASWTGDNTACYFDSNCSWTYGPQTTGDFDPMNINGGVISSGFGQNRGGVIEHRFCNQNGCAASENATVTVTARKIIRVWSVPVHQPGITGTVNITATTTLSNECQ